MTWWSVVLWYFTTFMEVIQVSGLYKPQKGDFYFSILVLSADFIYCVSCLQFFSGLSFLNESSLRE